MGPGLLAAASYIAVIALLVRRDAGLAPAAAPVPWAGRVAALARVWPVLLIAAIVLGGIYGGFFTPTEGAGVGVAATLAVGLLTRRLGFAGFVDVLRATAQTTGMIFAILLGAEMFNAFLALSQLPTALTGWVGGAGLPAPLVIAALLLIYLALGALMDEIAMLLLTLPVFFPVVMALDLGMDPESVAIWFGILVLVTVGVGLTAPPVGLNVFVVGALARDVPMGTIYRGVAPFILADLVRLVLLFAFPAIVLAPVGWLG
jgi:tripartite ATP-independent transporter DctM subunit